MLGQYEVIKYDTVCQMSIEESDITDVLFIC